MIKPVLCVCFLVLTVAPSIACKADESTDDNLSAEQIVTRYIDAVGGPERIAAVKTMIVKGTYNEGKFKIDATLARMRPYYKLVGDPEKRSNEFEEGYDGSAWEYYGNPGVVLRTVGAPSEAARHSTAILGTLVDYITEGATVSSMGTDTVGSQPAWRIRLRYRDGYITDEMISKKDYLLIAERHVAQIHAVGDDVDIEQRLSDYREVAGIRIPFHREEVNRKSGARLNSFDVSSVKVNVSLDTSDFSPPEFARTPLQTLIETLYEQRDDPQAMLWTLFDFRRAYPNQDSDLSCRIAGYQIRKAGQGRNAISLLIQNVKDHPDSAAAASSLGRAYLDMGELAAARDELTRALKMDPEDKRTQAAIEKLRRPD